MKTLFAISFVLAIVLPSLAEAGTSCTARRSGSVTITTCSNTSTSPAASRNAGAI